MTSPLNQMLPTCGGVGVVADRPPDMISSVMSRPPWLGSRIIIYQEKQQTVSTIPTRRATSKEKKRKKKETACKQQPQRC